MTAPMPDARLADAERALSVQSSADTLRRIGLELLDEVRRLRGENRRRDDVIRSLRSLPDHPEHDCQQIARARMAWEDRCHALEQQLVDGTGPDHLTVGECARCGKPALIPIDDPENQTTAVCSRCSHELAEEEP